MKRLFTYLLMWLGFSTAQAELLEGKCAYVQDGDTLKLQIPGQTEEIRIQLHGIDAPEKDQAFSTEARDLLRKLTQGKNIRVEVQDTDRYGRRIGKVYVGKTYVNLEMVKAGLAWHYAGSQDSEIEQAEAAARRTHKGLWQDEDAVNPRDHRKTHGSTHDTPSVTEQKTDTPVLPVGEVLRGKCVYVQDGDSLKFTADGITDEVRVRLHGIDAPEKGQDFSAQSRDLLRKLTLKKNIRLEVLDTDRYGRYIAKVYVGKTYVNLEMVKAGLAWHYSHHADTKADADLKKAQQSARKTKKGLWAGDNPINPREYREQHGTIHRG